MPGVPSMQGVDCRTLIGWHPIRHIRLKPGSHMDNIKVGCAAERQQAANVVGEMWKELAPLGGPETALHINEQHHKLTPILCITLQHIVSISQYNHHRAPAMCGSTRRSQLQHEHPTSATYRERKDGTPRPHYPSVGPTDDQNRVFVPFARAGRSAA